MSFLFNPNTSFQKMGRSSCIISDEPKKYKDPQPVASLTSKYDRFSPGNFANDRPILDSSDKHLFDDFEGPPQTVKQRIRKPGCNNELLSQALENQTRDTVDCRVRSGRLSVTSLGRVSNQFHHRNDADLSMTRKTNSFSITKVNNNPTQGCYGRPMANHATKIVPGATFCQIKVETEEDEIENYSDDERNTMKPQAHLKNSNQSRVSEDFDQSNRKISSMLLENMNYSSASFGSKRHTSISNEKNNVYEYPLDDATLPKRKKTSTDSGYKSKGVDPTRFHSKHNHDNLFEKLKTTDNFSDEEWTPEVSPKNTSTQGRHSTETRVKTNYIENRTRRSSRTRRPLRGIGNKSGDVIELMDSDDDSVFVVTDYEQKRISPRRAVGEKIRVDATRIAIGSKVFRSECEISFQPGGKEQYISICYRTAEAKEQHKFVLEDNHLITDIKYYLADDNDSDESHPSSDDVFSFLAMRITPTESNNLKKYPNIYASDEKLEDITDRFDKRRYIVVEVRRTYQFKNLLSSMKMNSILDENLVALEDDSHIRQYSMTLLEERRKDRESRYRNLSRNDASNKALLVYPFNALDEVIEDAALGLKEAGIQIGKITSSMTKTDINDPSESQDKVARAHYLTIRDEDRLRLIQDDFLNDTLVDFWMQWISRFERKRISNMHFFTSHFFTTLVNEGPEGVSSWTMRREINIFEKKFIFIPINERLHWSLCVVVHPGKIRHCFVQDQPFEDDEIPCLLFFDSLKAHRKQRIGKFIREWLNFESKRLEYVSCVTTSDSPFDEQTMPLYDPKVPYQENSWDCGVFVCRYALGLMQNVEKPFTRKDSLEKFGVLITDSVHFKFSMNDIHRIRREMNSLILKLSTIFQATKAEEDEKLRCSKEQSSLPAEVGEPSQPRYSDDNVSESK